MAEASGERALRAELGELRARLAESDRVNVLLTETNRLLTERLAELERRLGREPAQQ